DYFCLIWHDNSGLF
nr:immunoglobulin light chain junction region [Macaca mulatta]